MIRGQYRDVLLFEPGNHGSVESGIFAALGSSAQIWTGLLPACPHTGANEQSITRLDFQSSLFEPCLDVFNVDRSARFEIFHSLKLRDIDEDAASEDSILEVVY